MPRVKIDYVVSFSSEDPDNPASNLLGWDVSKRRWLCPKGEPSCSVVLQLPRALKVNAVHVGAHQAALVEVLVGRSETPNEPFQVLVPSCVFLSPAESRRAERGERVRSFGAEQLAAGARAQRWDRLRLVCTQPYNKHCKYGLNFVHIYSDEGPQAASAPPGPSPARLPAGDASSEDEFTPGELFAAHRSAPQADTSAQIRRATSEALRHSSDSASKLVKTPISKPEPGATRGPRPEPEAEPEPPAGRARPALLYTDDDDRPHGRIDHVVRRHREERSKEDAIRPKTGERHDSERDKHIEIKKKDKHESSRKATSKDESQKDKRRTHERTPKDDERSKPSAAKEFRNENGSDRKRPRDDDHSDKGRAESLLRGVVCVLSGYENPRRAAVRDLALRLGARCERDWGPRCTHLICAFPNTPKLRAVRAGAGGAAAAVVTAEWLEACRDRRRRLPWQWFATEPQHRRAAPPADDPPTDDSPAGDDEECDTDDEIERALRKQKKRRTEESSAGRAGRRSASGERDASGASDVVFVRDERLQGDVTVHDSDDDATDEERDAEARAEGIDPAAALPELFEGRSFVLDDSAAPARLLERYVRAYGGLVLDASQLDEESSVDYVLSRRARARRGAACVRPAWLWRCHRERRLLPPGDYLLA